MLPYTLASGGKNKSSHVINSIDNQKQTKQQLNTHKIFPVAKQTQTYKSLVKSTLITSI